MSGSHSMISVEHVSKGFKLPHEKNASIKSAVVNFYRRKKGYELQKALRDVSFEVKEGEFFGIVGRNGSGKSTLLKLLAGIYVPTKGHIQVNGKLTPFIELGVGFNPELTGRENVYLNGALLGFSRKEMNVMYNDIVEFAELERFMDQKLKNYSSGMQVRLAFSIAIRAKSSILLIDEVLAVGDVNFQKKCYDYFTEVKQEGRTIIFVSHDLKSVERFCDTVLILDRGKQIGLGSAQDMVFRYSTLMANESEAYDAKNAKEQGVHFGNQDLKINKVSIIKTGKPVKTLAVGDPIRLKIDIVCRRPTREPVLHFSIFSAEDNKKLLSANSEQDNKKISEIKEATSMAIEWTDHGLAPGKYRVNVGIFTDDMRTPVDHFRDALTFEIKGENWGNYQLSVPASWELNN